jgi:hypothetical protein
MEKEEKMNKKGLGWITGIFLLLVLTVGYAVSQNADFNLETFKGNLNWSDKDLDVESAPDLGEALEDIVNGLGNAAFNMARWAAELSYNNPNVPWKLLIYLVIFAVLSPIVVAIIKIGALIFIFIKDFILNRREKRELRALKNDKTTRT